MRIRTNRGKAPRTMLGRRQGWENTGTMLEVGGHAQIFGTQMASPVGFGTKNSQGLCRRKPVLLAKLST